jgi:hypothetical protein
LRFTFAVRADEVVGAVALLGLSDRRPSGSLNHPDVPEATQVLGFWMMAGVDADHVDWVAVGADRRGPRPCCATTESRMLFFSRTPSGP